MKKLLLLLSLSVVGSLLEAQISPGNFVGMHVPLYMSSGNTTRLPVVYRARVRNLMPMQIYKYVTSMVIASDLSSNSLLPGAGNALYTDTGGWKYTTTAGFTSGAHDTLYSDGTGEYEGWFCVVPTNNSRFTPGNFVYPQITLIGMTFFDTQRFYCDDSIRVQQFSTASGVDNCTGIWGKSQAKARSIVGLYDFTMGLGRPLAMTYVENEKISVGSTVGYYASNVNGVNGNWGTSLPNNLANGLRRVENYSLIDGFPIYANTDSNGIWGPSKKNTVNPNGGTTPIAFDNDDAAMVPPLIEFWARTSTVAETAGNLNVMVTRKFSNEHEQTVRLYQVGGTATKGTDYSVNEPVTIKFKMGGVVSDTTKITITDDQIAEGDETIVLRLDQNFNSQIGVEVAHTITITDNDIAKIYLSPTYRKVKETDGSTSIIVKMDKATTTPSKVRVTVKYKGDSTFIPGEFKLGAGGKDSVFFIGKTTGPDSISIPANIFDETKADPNDTIIIALRQISGNAVMGDSILLIVVVDNDGPSAVKFLNTKITVKESDASFKVKIVVVTRTDASADFTLRMLNTFSTATEGADFTFNPTSKIISIDNNLPDTVIVDVPLLTDNLYEGSELITFSLGVLSNVKILKPDTFRVTILDDDYPYYKINKVTSQSGVNKVVDSLNVKCRISGTVYGGNLRSNPGIQFTVRDNTGGISVFSASSAKGYFVSEGDSVMIQGTITQFQGLPQMNNLDTVIVLAKNRVLKNPVLTTKLSETTESDLIKVMTVKLLKPSEWPTSALAPNTFSTVSYETSTGVRDTMQIDAETNIDGTTAPQGYFNVTGIGAQFDATAPYTTKYTIVPRSLSDIQTSILPVIKFSKKVDSITELATTYTAQMEVAPTTENFTVQIVIKSGVTTAVKGPDYTTSPDFPRTVSVLKNNTNYSQSVGILNDNVFDDDKILVFALRNVNGPGIIGADSILAVFIRDVHILGMKTLGASGIKMYPNPATTQLQIASPVAIRSLEIFSMQGARVMRVAPNANRFNVALESLAKGMYLVRMSNSAGETFTEQLSVQ